MAAQPHTTASAPPPTDSTDSTDSRKKRLAFPARRTKFAGNAKRMRQER
jgi:hypothetical protein